jgi:hypothetical protein
MSVTKDDVLDALRALRVNRAKHVADSGLRHMEARLRIMGDHDLARPKLVENIDRKASFLARLRAEQAGL